MYPKSKSPSELKYGRLRGMCGEAWENVRYIPVDNGIQQHGEHGGIWLVLCVYQYTDCMAAGQHGIPSVQDSTAGRKHGIPMQQGIYLCTICEHSIQPPLPEPLPELRNARVRVSRARACVRALYYYIIIILLYYYIYIYPEYPVYPIYSVYIIYPIYIIYPTMVI